MQLTIEIPEALGRRLDSEKGRLAEILELGLRLRQWVGDSALAKEIIGFLAKGPRPQEIVAFHPSEAAIARSRELLQRNEAGGLSAAEEAELEEMALLDHLVTLIKAQAWQLTRSGA